MKAAKPEIEAAQVGAQRDDVRALVRELSARLVSSSSATRTLQAWCDEHAIGTGPITVLCAQWARGSNLSEDVLDALRPDPGEPISHRRVHLMRGNVVLAEADNWFAPHRLGPGMWHMLENTNVPFGVVIEPLNPSRRTFFVEFCEAHVGSPARAVPTSQVASAPILPEVIFEHRAVVACGERRSLAVVCERYRSALLAIDW